MTVGTTSVTSKSPKMATVGTTINLISKAQVRYEGALYTVDPIVGTVALANVHVHGTESRTAPKVVPPSDEVYDYILFRGSDIQDLTVSDPPNRELSAPQKDLPLAAVLTDPAVIRTAVRPPLEPRIVPPASGSRAGGMHHQFFHPDTLGRRRQNSEGPDDRPRGRGPNFYQNRGRDTFYRDSEDSGPRRRNNSGFGGGGGGYGGYGGWQGPRNPQFSMRSDQRPYRSYFSGGGGGSGDYEARTPQRVVFLPRGASRPPPMPPRDSRNNNRRPDGPREAPRGDGPRASVLRRPVVMYARQTERSFSPGAPGSQGGPFRQQRPRTRPRSGSRQGQNAMRGAPHEAANVKETFQSDYDFEKMNAELELEFQKDPESPHKSPEAKSDEPEPVEGSPCYDKTVSFFDRIGRVNEAPKSRPDRSDERRINEETFGRYIPPSRRGRRPGPRPNLRYY